MEQAAIRIKNAVTELLKRTDPETDVFYEEIKGTEEGYGLEIPETYYFVDILPAGNETVDGIFTDMRVLVDIAYHRKGEGNTAYLIKGEELDGAFRPVFCFGGRKITIRDASIKIVDHVLHYSFAIGFRQAREQAETHERMGELEVALRKGEWF